MAERPVFIPIQTGDVLVDTKIVSFMWHPGLSVAQKQRSIKSMHQNIASELGLKNALEISSKSPAALGVELSAFNLQFTAGTSCLDTTVECAFQGSKVFVGGGPFTDIYSKSSRDAKGDHRLKESGPLVGFRFLNHDWPPQPLTAFYDWLYINALHSHEDLRNEVLSFRAFTDIEFNPKKSINCQAYSAALYVSLVKRKIFSDVVRDPQSFLAYLKETSVVSTSANEATQGKLNL